MEIISLLKEMTEMGASDLFLTVGAPPSVKVVGKVQRMSKENCTLDDIEKNVLGLMNEKQKNEFESTHECNFAFAAKNTGRFRVSAYIQRGHPACVIRHIKALIPSIEELKLPETLREIAMLKKGLVLIIGGTGVGKTTTLAAMLNYRNKMSSEHILTVEDPIEYLHSHGKSIFTQREVGVDTESFDIALKNALRQSPDVIQIGEIRDLNTMRHALAFSETGHLCLATLHASNTTQALERMAHFYPEDIRDQLWLDLSLNLRSIVGQKLIAHVTEHKNVPAVEILINTPIIQERIRRGEAHLINDQISQQNEQGMRSFDQALYLLHTQGEITLEEALANAHSVNDLRLMIKLKTNKPISE